MNTRPRDFYDVYILIKTQSFEHSVFTEALKRTAEHRVTTHIFNNTVKRIEDLQESETLKSRWLKYTKDYRYAEDIAYDDVIEAIMTPIKF